MNTEIGKRWILHLDYIRRSWPFKTRRKELFCWPFEILNLLINYIYDRLFIHLRRFRPIHLLLREKGQWKPCLKSFETSKFASIAHLGEHSFNTRKDQGFDVRQCLSSFDCKLTRIFFFLCIQFDCKNSDTHSRFLIWSLFSLPFLHKLHYIFPVISKAYNPIDRYIIIDLSSPDNSKELLHSKYYLFF